MHKKISLLILTFLIAGCVDVNIKELKYNEVFGEQGSKFEGKIFSATCKGEDSDEETIEKECLYNIAKTTHEKGYEYFSIFTKDSKTTQEVSTTTTNKAITARNYSGGYKSSTFYIPETDVYTTTLNTKYYGFILVDKKELSKLQNYYKVSDYYNPEK